MIRQPLARIGNPLAFCDYHEVSAPWREQFSTGQLAGRGAAGRPIAKDAFCYALEQILAASSTAAGLQHLLDDAMAAFRADYSYAAAMAKAAVTIASKRHTAVLRQRLRQAAHQAVSQCDMLSGGFTCTNPSPCGTGSCRFAQGDLVLIEITSTGKKNPRPANHISGGQFSPDDALGELEKLVPFAVSVPVRDSDEGSGADQVAALWVMSTSSRSKAASACASSASPWSRTMGAGGRCAYARTAPARPVSITSCQITCPPPVPAR